MLDEKSPDLETKCVHAGELEHQNHPVTFPIYQTSTFRFTSTDQGAALFRGEAEGYIYSRMRNPTVEAMEDAVACLEGGYKALGCASGMGAVNTLFSSLLKTGDHVICSKAVYGPTSTLLGGIYSKFGVSTSFVDTSDMSQIESAFRSNTRLLYIETPGNPTLDITDIKKASGLAHSKNVLVAVDNTFMSPALQNPLALGADLVVHSMTKYINGHGDTIAGIVVVKEAEMYDGFRKILNQTGAVIDPFNSFLVHRGLKTLGLRMKKHCENAIIVAEFLESRAEIAWVRYPGLKSHPQYQLAKSQMKGSGGMISFEMKGGLEAGKKMLNSLKLCQLAVSLGGVESLIEHPASMTHSSMTKEARLSAGITDGLVRLSVGTEDVNDLIEDLAQALNSL